MLVSKQDASRAVSIADACGMAASTASSRRKPRPSLMRRHAHNAHSAIFAEVKVDEQLGVIRVTRVVSAVAAGRILNTKTASSQIIGGVVWGIGMALHEETLIDHKFGRIMNANIAEYHVPVNADVHDIKVIFVDETDDISIRSASRGSAKSASSASPRRSPTRSITPPASACATCRSRSTNCNDKRRSGQPEQHPRHAARMRGGLSRINIYQRRRSLQQRPAGRFLR